MDEEHIKLLKQKAETEFNALKEEGDKARTRIQEIETRLAELRGEYQAYGKLVPEKPSVKVKGEGKKNG